MDTKQGIVSDYSAIPVNSTRRKFLAGATSVLGGIGLIGASVPFVASWKPSAKAKAAGAPVRIDIEKLEPGGRIVVEWRGKPVYVIRRTKEALDSVCLLYTSPSPRDS